SPLLQHLWSFRLLPPVDHQIPYPCLFSFVEPTVSCFKPSKLTGPDRRIVASQYRPPEYQEEYYRCVHDATKGNVRFTPEYVAAVGVYPGRIHFFIPSHKWGIELTYDGSQLSEHESRFADDDAYEQWLQTLDMMDYILLDFCSTKPSKPHSDIKNLYHVIFDTDTAVLKYLIINWVFEPRGP
ncbi:hypothetical protein CPB86DRAFT_38650, partial [Serendipita vermifera]